MKNFEEMDFNKKDFDKINWGKAILVGHSIFLSFLLFIGFIDIFFIDSKIFGDIYLFSFLLYIAGLILSFVAYLCYGDIPEK